LSLSNGLFDRILGQPVIPFIVEGLFCSDNRFQGQFQAVFAGFTEIPVGKVEVVPVGSGLADSMLTYITGKGFHGQLLLKFIDLLYYIVAQKRKKVEMAGAFTCFFKA
jgi:hypothetical protein